VLFGIAQYIPANANAVSKISIDLFIGGASSIGVVMRGEVYAWQEKCATVNNGFFGAADLRSRFPELPIRSRNWRDIADGSRVKLRPSRECHLAEHQPRFSCKLCVTISVGALSNSVRKYRHYTDRCLSGVKKGEQTGARLLERRTLKTLSGAGPKECDGMV